MFKPLLLSCCIVSILVLSGCSKKEAPVPDLELKTEGTTEIATPIKQVAVNQHVIVSKNDVSALPLIDGNVYSNFVDSGYSYANPEEFSLESVDSYSGQHTQSFEKILAFARQKLNLRDDQIIVAGGDAGPVNDSDTVLFDLTNQEYYKYSNNFAINYIRLLKTVPVDAKGEFETTEQYQERIKVLQESPKNHQVDFDLSLLQTALNKTLARLYVKNGDAKPEYQYDADQELLTLALKEKESTRVVESLLKIKIPSDLAQEIVTNSNWQRGYVLDFKDNRLSVSGVFFYKFNFTVSDRDQVYEGSLDSTSVYKLLDFKQKSYDQMDHDVDPEKLSFQDISTSSANTFIFGLKHYFSPESRLKKLATQNTSAED
ncbi:hypothetical protein [Acinetobacter sp. ESBL14]|uniref:hypothetical protein n=1 Tax=Acinetobacter sp. ESBL14 TaxID=3077329 RepID=UPI002FC6DA53